MKTNRLATMNDWRAKNRGQADDLPGSRRACAVGLVWASMLGLLLIAGGSGRVHGMDAQSSVDAARKALADRGDYPWYDARQDRLKRIDVQPPRESAANRGSTWQATPDPVRADSWLRILLRSLGSVLKWVVWASVAAALVALVVLLARTFVRRESGQFAEETVSEQARTEADLIEKLPFPVRLPQSDLLSEARRCYEQGDYAQAVIYLFSYKLLALDRHGLIRVTRGKTNRQYLAELLLHPPLQQMLEHTMIAFEDVFFGHHPLGREQFESCWSQLDGFHQRIQQAGP